MLNPKTQRQRLISAIQTLPDEVLSELTGFVGYLQYRGQHPDEQGQPNAALHLNWAPQTSENLTAQKTPALNRSESVELPEVLQVLQDAYLSV